jgi:hypothetical protein
MIKKEQLEKLRGIVGFDLGQTEKDYLQHLFLLFLSKYSKNELVFKGGTALQKTLGLNRFSIDLDFTLLNPIDLAKLIGKIVIDFNNYGYKAIQKEIKKKVSYTTLLKIQGPLYDGRDKTLSPLRIEISLREKAILQPRVMEITPFYPDLQPYLLYLMQPEEILAEKVRAITTRAKARDIFDLHFLLKKGIKLDKGLINEKLSYYGQELDLKKFKEKIGMEKGIWEHELKPLLGRVPDLEKVKKFIVNSLKTMK